MTDSTHPRPRHDEPMDRADLELLADIVQLQEELDPTPPMLADLVLFALQDEAHTMDLDAELAMLIEAELAVPAGARSVELARRITFSSDHLTVMIAIASGAGGTVRVDGWAAPGGRRARACLDRGMTASGDEQRSASASREIAAPAGRIFELIADPEQQPRWDGNDNLAAAAPGQRVHAIGDIFAMTITNGAVRENHVVEFVEGERIAWKPAEPGKPPTGHLWRWELQPVGDGTTLVTHTYDWTELSDPNREKRARWTTSERLQASLDRLADLAEQG